MKRQSEWKKIVFQCGVNGIPKSGGGGGGGGQNKKHEMNAVIKIN